MKMYILVKETTPLGFALVAAAHASLAAYLKFQHTPEIATWVSGPFYRVICKVTDAEFERAKTESDFVVINESGLNNMEVAIAFKPREQWPTFFKFLKLYK